MFLTYTEMFYTPIEKAKASFHDLIKNYILAVRRLNLSLRFKISFRNFWKYHLITLLPPDFYVVFMTKFYYLKC